MHRQVGTKTDRSSSSIVYISIGWKRELNRDNKVRDEGLRSEQQSMGWKRELNRDNKVRDEGLRSEQ